MSKLGPSLSALGLLFGFLFSFLFFQGFRGFLLGFFLNVRAFAHGFPLMTQVEC